MARSLALLVLMSACSTDRSESEAGGSEAIPDSGVDRDSAPPHGEDGGGSDAGAADAGGADAGGTDAGMDAGHVDAAPCDGGVDHDAAPGGMVITSVVVDDSFTQVRQGSTFELLISGSGLQGVIEVSVPDGVNIEPTSLIATATEVRVGAFVDHGAAPGPRDITLTGADGVVTETEAFEVTPFIIDAAAGEGGRATYESPMLLCDGRMGEAANGDLVLLSPGEHECAGVQLGGGMELRGAGIDATTVRIFELFVRNNQGSRPTVVRDLSFILPAPDGAGLLRITGPGPAELRNLRLDGMRIDTALDGGSVVVDRVAIDARGADCILSNPAFKQLRISNSVFSRCGTGIYFTTGDLEVTDTTISQSQLGIRFGARPPGETPTGTIARVDLLDNQVGLIQGLGFMTMTDIEIRASAAMPEPAQTGMILAGGLLQVTGLQISGHVASGIDVLVFAGEDFDNHGSLGVSDAIIEGGTYGIFVNGSSDGANLFLQNSIVRDQSVAAVRLRGIDESAFRIENSELSVLPGGIALEDAREDPPVLHEIIEAPGTTLNGHSYAGMLFQGPLSMAPDFTILSDDGFIQF